MKLRRPVTPAEVSIHLRELIKQIAPDQAPVYVNIDPLEDAPINECFLLVQFVVERQGGQAVVGWSLAELPGLFSEAEAHCVWRRPDGLLVDVTPKKHDCQRIFFLPDTQLRYEGRQIDNIRRPHRQDPALLAYLQSFADEFDLMNRGDRAMQHGEIVLAGADLDEHFRIQDARTLAVLALGNQFPDVGPYLPCPCGSGKKTKWCHKEFLNDGGR